MKISDAEHIKYVKKMADLTRYDLVAMLSYTGSGHPGGSLSIVEILAALYYGGIIKYDPADPFMQERDRLILSKGHASPALYVILAELGYFPKSWLREFDKNGSRLPKHCDRCKTPGIEASTGALGQGISMAVGMALAQQLDDIPYDIYCIIGDGECQSGNTYEAAMSAGKFRLNRLKVILDNNGLQIDGNVSDIMPLGEVEKTWESLGWKVYRCDGHDITQLLSVFEEMKQPSAKPQLLIADTVKGKGVSFMEHNVDWHSEKISKDLAITALRELGEILEDMNDIEPAAFLSREELNSLTGSLV